MKPYTEFEVQQALQAIDKGKSVRQASVAWGVPRSTLRGRIHGAQTRQTASIPRQRLSPTQEARLADWVLSQADLGLPPTHSELRLFAQRVLEVKGDNLALGKRWVEAFLKRNPSIKTQRSRRMDFSRVNGAKTEVIKSWFRLLNQPQVRAIKPSNRWNMDEAGILEGEGDNGLVLGHSSSRSIQKQQPGSRVWTSFIECISATGSHLPPLVIFKGMTIQDQWFPLDLSPFKGWKFSATPKGWTDNEMALEWLQKLFVPLTAPEDPLEPRLLIMDGHRSHATTEFMWNCFKNNIYVIYLPPHTSHVLQPLDLAVFSSLKSAYRKRLSYLAQWSNQTAVGKRAFLETYRRARLDGLSSQNIKSGWKASGCWPVSMAKPLMSPLLLENSQRSARNEDFNTPTIISTFKSTQGVGKEIASNGWSTPKKSRDLQDQLQLFNRLKTPHPTQRLLFRKLTKGFEDKDYHLAHALQKIESLEAQLVAQRPQKRKKVEMSPNSKFVGIEAIHAAENGDSEVDDSLSNADKSDVHIDIEDCIVVQEMAVE